MLFRIVNSIIHMNGRIYDPSLGRMLSPDPVTQAAENGQNYNRYTYAYNNPLKYTDPSGYTTSNAGEPGSSLNNDSSGFSLSFGSSSDFPYGINRGFHKENWAVELKQATVETTRFWLARHGGETPKEFGSRIALEKYGDKLSLGGTPVTPNTISIGESLYDDADELAVLQATVGAVEVALGATACAATKWIGCALVASGARNIIEATTGNDLIVESLIEVGVRDSGARVAALMVDMGQSALLPTAILHGILRSSWSMPQAVLQGLLSAGGIVGIPSTVIDVSSEPLSKSSVEEGCLENGKCYTDF